MPTPAQFRTLVDQTLQVARLLLQCYRLPGNHPTSDHEQRVLQHVLSVLQEAFAEVQRLLVPRERHRGGSGFHAAPSDESDTSSQPDESVEPDVASRAVRRPRP